jgi:hypothetical protein
VRQALPCSCASRGLHGLFAAFLFVVFVLAWLPSAGAARAAAARLPGFRSTARARRPPLPRAFIEPLRAGRPRLLAIAQIGLIGAAAWVILWLSDLFDGGALTR